MKNVGVVWKKEMLDAVRDPRTLFLMIVFPLILNPLLMFGMGYMAKSQEQEIKTTTAVIAVQHGALAPGLLRLLAAKPHVQVIETDSITAWIRSKRAAAGLAIPPDAPASLAAGRSVKLDVYSDDTRELSRHARGLVEEAVNAYDSATTAQMLRQRGMPSDLAKLVHTQRHDAAPPARKSGYILALILPYFLALAVANGATSTAIDTTTGEKDRSTLETILVSSSNRMGIMIGKLLAVVTTGFVAVISSAVSMALMFLGGGFLFMSSGSKDLSFTVSPGAILAVVALALPVAVLLSAVLMALGCFAKSAREGQTQAVWVQMAVIFGALGTMFQQTEPKLTSFLVPVLGSALAQREILLGEAQASHIALAVLSSVVLAAVAIVVAVRLFGNEKVMFRAK